MQDQAARVARCGWPVPDATVAHMRVEAGDEFYSGNFLGIQQLCEFYRARARSEFWYWALFAILASIAGELIDLALFTSSTFTPVQTLVNLALFLPGLAVSVRRLHDLDRTGWWLLLIFTVIGMIVLLVWDCMRGTVGPNRFGPDPLAAASPSQVR